MSNWTKKPRKGIEPAIQNQPIFSRAGRLLPFFKFGVARRIFIRSVYLMGSGGTFCAIPANGHGTVCRSSRTEMLAREALPAH
jgi:hypothetical protein